MISGIHLEFYRLLESTILLAKRGKILLAVEKGELAKDFVLMRKYLDWSEKFWVSEAVGWGLKTEKLLILIGQKSKN